MTLPPGVSLGYHAPVLGDRWRGAVDFFKTGHPPGARRRNFQYRSLGLRSARSSTKSAIYAGGSIILHRRGADGSGRTKGRPAVALRWPQALCECTTEGLG